MKLEQKINDTCIITSTINAIDIAEQTIMLQITNTTPDKEKVAVVARVTNDLIKEGWIIADTQSLKNVTTIEYTKLCSVTELLETMLKC